MSDSAGKHIKRYLDHTRDRSKQTCLIHGPGHSLDECKFLGDFGSKYFKRRNDKDLWHDNANRKKLNIKQENNTIDNHSVDEIILQGNNKVSAKSEAHENMDSEIYYNGLCYIKNGSPDENK